jgi:hypothetical protein
LRILLIHGGRSALPGLAKSETRLGTWLRALPVRPDGFICWRSRGRSLDALAMLETSFARQRRKDRRGFGASRDGSRRRVGMRSQTSSRFDRDGQSPEARSPRRETNAPRDDGGVRENLAAFFRPYNEELYALLDKDFGWGVR